MALWSAANPELGTDPAVLEMLTAPPVFAKVVDILGWNIAVRTIDPYP
eukprot:SAG31_NODE_868_length_11355_cov_4.658582_11_plen_48_part_00